MKKNSSLKRKEDERMEGVILAAKYSWNCEGARIKNCSQDLSNIATRKRKSSETATKMLSTLSSFEFYKALARNNGIDNPLDKRIVSYYWKGTPKLEGEFWHNFTTLLPLIKMPAEKINTDIINECLIHPAEIIGRGKNFIDVKYRPVTKNKKEDRLKINKDFAEKRIGNKMLKKNYVGCKITMHFSEAVEMITEEEQEELLQITEVSLKKFNNAKIG